MFLLSRRFCFSSACPSRKEELEFQPFLKKESFSMCAYRLIPVLFLFLAASYADADAASTASGFSIDNIDKSADPCVDFYQYACGNWMKSSEIPADRPSWQSFSELDERNLGIERGILEKAASGGVGRNAVDQKIGDLYGSCMDEKAVNAKGISPLKPELDRVAAVKDKSTLIDEIAHVHVVGPSPLFNFYSQSDLHNADTVIAYIDQGGLSLPDRDYYIKDDARMVDMRKHYVDYVTEMFTLAGPSAGQSRGSAQNGLCLRTAPPHAFVDANFKMRQALTGQKQIQDRWKRCVGLVDGSLGEALGQRYVEITFGADGKQRMLKMVDALEKSLNEDIEGLEWMSPETKKQANVKLQAIRNKIGYPDVYRDYSSVAITPNDLLGNVERSTEFESKREIAKIGKPLDRKEWGMTPTEVNADYSGSDYVNRIPS